MCYDNTTPLISVIMGVYNIAGLPTFYESVNSILQQTEKNFEFIICDDGSQDETWSTICQFAKLDHRIRLLRHTHNLGLAAALNTCLSHARGKFIARQDADDLSMPDRLHQQIVFLKTHPDIGFVGSNITLYDHHGIWGERVFPEYPQPKDFLFTMPFVHGVLMFRREILTNVNGYHTSWQTRRAEDYDLLMRLYAIGIRGVNLPAHLYSFLEDQAALKRRKYRYRFGEVSVRWNGFRKLHLFPIALPYVIKPLVVGLIPHRILVVLKKTRPY